MNHLSGKVGLAFVLLILSCAVNLQSTQADLPKQQMPDDPEQSYTSEVSLGRSCDNLGPSFPAWSSWRPTHWKNIDYRVRCECEPNKSERSARYMWWVQFQSRYPQPIHLSYDLAEKDTPHPGLHTRGHFRNGEQLKYRQQDLGDNWFLLKTPCNGIVTLWLGKLVLGSEDNLGGPFISPDK